MNTLTQAGVLAEDRLFATLDPTARALKRPGGKSVVLIDTVGLIRRLPHHLVEAFKSTLEQAATAYIILNICDASNEEVFEHIKVTEDILGDLGSEQRPVITVMNKSDKVGPDTVKGVKNAVYISALNGTGIDELLKVIEDNLPEKTIRARMILPFEKSGIASMFRDEGYTISEEYVETGIEVLADVGIRHYKLIESYVVDKK